MGMSLLQEIGTNSVVQMSDGSVKVKTSLCSVLTRRDHNLQYVCVNWSIYSANLSV